jgi:hypothetical protein
MRLFFISLLNASMVCAQPNEANIELQKRKFERIADVYEGQAMGYVQKFADSVFAPLSKIDKKNDTLRSVRKANIASVVILHKSNLKKFREETFKYIFYTADTKTFSSKQMIDLFDIGYKSQFLFLDYHFYERCWKELETLK